MVVSKLILKRNSKGEGTKKSKECQRVVGSGGEWWGIVATGEERLRVVKWWGMMESGEQVNSEEKLKGEMHKEKQT